jgi:hypothetical protein
MAYNDREETDRICSQLEAQLQCYEALVEDLILSLDKEQDISRALEEARNTHWKLYALRHNGNSPRLSSNPER